MRPSKAFLTALLASGCIAGAGELPVDHQTSAIVGGTVDNGDPGVVLIFAQIPNTQEGSLCTGEVISPHVILTAAHCVSPAIVGANAQFVVYNGTDFNEATQQNVWRVKTIHYNTQWNPNNLSAGHDIGVVILEQPTTVKPLPYMKQPMTQAMVNQPVRFVGYGITSGGPNGTGAGVKRQVSSTLTAYNNVLLQFTDPNRGTCSGDSGGPAFMTVNGVETIVGVTSFGDELCQQSGYDTRVDAERAWFEPYIAMYDPPPAANPDPEPEPEPGASTGTDTEPGAQPDPQGNPDPGSDSGSGEFPGQNNGSAAAATANGRGIGQSCSRDSDCASGACGVGDTGTLVCVGATPTNNATLGGCSQAGSPARSLGDLALVLLLGALATLRRRLSVGRAR